MQLGVLGVGIPIKSKSSWPRLSRSSGTTTHTTGANGEFSKGPESQ